MKRHKQKKLNYAAEFLEQSLEMLRMVHGRNSPYPDIMAGVSNSAIEFEDQGRWDEALAVRERNTETDEIRNGEEWNRSIGN